VTPAERAELLAALELQAALGADEAIAEAPQDRFAETARGPAARVRGRAPQGPPDAPQGPRGGHTAAPLATGAAPASPREPAAPADRTGCARPAGTAAELAAEAADLAALESAIRGWEGSELRRGARSCVFADGNPAARLMIVGEAPGAEEDRQGRPFVGRAGRLLDRMLAAIGLDRHAEDPARAAYITNILPFRPPGNRTPSDAEALAFLPFVERHIALAAPEVILCLGNTPTRALLGTGAGIRRMRGQWRRHAGTGLALLPSFHPAYLLRQPAEKAHAWRDLLALRRALDGAPPDIPD
jgi:DNA polymerase